LASKAIEFGEEKTQNKGSLLFKFRTLCVFKPPLWGLGTMFILGSWKVRKGLPISVN